MLALEKIVKTYNVGNQMNKVIDSLSITFPDIGFIGIKGESGSGKSTLLNIISGLQKADSGFVLFDGKLIDEDFLKKEVSIVSQNNDLLSSLNVKDNILMSSKISCTEYDKRLYEKLIDELELNEHLYKYPHQLSVGQMKKVSIVRGILKKSSILLCDEPTGALHSQQGKDIMEILKNVSQKRLVIIVSHDQCLLEEYCDCILTLENGKINGKIIENKIVKKEEKKVKKYSLLFYVLRRMVKDKYILLFMFVFEVIIIVSLFLLISGMNGIETLLNKSHDTSVERNVLRIEQFDNQFFEEPIGNEYMYDYILSYGQLSIDGEMKFLPVNCQHIELYEGRLPENNNELIVSYDLYEKLNDEIGYEYDQQKISLKIVGVLNRGIFNEKTIYFNNDFKSLIPHYINKSVLVLESDDAIKMYDELSKNYIVYNDSIEMRNSYMSLLNIARVMIGIFLGLSLLCSFFLFYIIYQTLGMKRKHDNALLLMMGLSIYKLFGLYMVESIVIGLLLSLLGNTFSLLIYYYLNYVISIKSLFLFELKIDSLYFVLISGVYILLNIVSAYLPTKKLINSHLIMLLREEE